METLLPLLFIGLFMAMLGVLYWRKRNTELGVEQQLTHRLRYGEGDAAPVRGSASIREARWSTSLRIVRVPEWLLEDDLPFPLWLYAGATIVLFVVGFSVTRVLFGPLISFALACAAALLPLIYLRLRHERLLRTIGVQLPYVLDLTKSALQSGHTLMRALQLALASLPPPISEEVRRVLDRVQLGETLAESLNTMYTRLPIEELGQLVVALKIQEKVGSSLAETLQHVSDSLRARQRIVQQIRSLTAQSRSSAVIVTVLPAAVLGMFTLVRPDYAAPLFHDTLGIKMLELAIGLDAAAFIIMRRIAKLDY